MPDPATYRPPQGSVPTEPGVYRFRDSAGQVIYVGKATSLRSRLSSYFQDSTGLHPRTARMVRTGASVEWTVVSSEVEALQLEYQWIKEFDPPFNVKYRDDKSYPYLAITMAEEFPRAQVVRGRKRKGTRYFGPYTHAWAIRETLDQLLRVFPVRTCSAGAFRSAAASGRPCLLGYIDKCSAPCVGRVSADEHRDLAQDLGDFLAGDTSRFVKRLDRQMRQAAAELDFERAARLRDDLAALDRALERSAVVLPDHVDADVFGVVGDELEVAVQVFFVRGGRVRGQRGWVAERDAETMPAMVQRLLQQVYGPQSGAELPREVLVPVLPQDHTPIEEWLASLRGKRVRVSVPSRGDRRSLAETVRRNAEQSLARHKVARAGDLTTRGRALAELADYLDLEDAPLRIECFDVSHIQGTNVVASMVVFEDGLPRTSAYRRFVIRGEAQGSPDEGEGRSAPVRSDDTAAMRHVLARRLRRLTGDTSADQRGGPVDPEEPERPGFAYRPGLLVVDGGLPQVNAAAAVLAEAGVVDIPVIGLAKRLEEVWRPGDEHPVILPRSSDGLYLLQRIRDEAHRFAITHHRQRRSRAMTASVLDDIPGLGPVRSAALLAHFGTVKKLRAAPPDQIAEVPGIGPALAAVVASHLAGAGESTPAVNLTTGEVLDP